MLKEFIGAIEELSKQGQFPRVLKPDAEPDHVYFLALPNGQVEALSAKSKPRAHLAGDLISLANFVREAKSDDGSQIVVWFNRAGVVALLNDETRRDRVTLPLVLHTTLKVLAALEVAKPSYKQREFVRLLRIDLDGTGAEPLIEVVRRLKFRQGSQGDSVVAHGKASVGRQIEAELTGAGTIPEHYTLQVPVFAGPLQTLKFPVRCAIEIAPDTETFQLLPFPGAIEEAICDAEEVIGMRLAEVIGDAAHVYYGQP